MNFDFDGEKLEIRRNKRKGRTAYLVNTKGSTSCSECCLRESYCKEMGHHNICWELMIKGVEHYFEDAKNNTRRRRKGKVDPK